VRRAINTRVVIELVSGLTILGLATVAFVANQRTEALPPNSDPSAATDHPPAPADHRVREVARTVASNGAAPSPSDPSAHDTQGQQARQGEAAAEAAIPPCDKPGGMGLSRIVEIDTIGGPVFGLQHLKGYDFLRDKEVVLTFDDGPWPGGTAAVLQALRDQCLKATFFEIGEHASWRPELTREVLAAGMTVGTHTWSHKDLARGSYAKDLEKAEQEIELGNSAVHVAAAGASVAPFFRFPDLQQTPQLLDYLAQRNIAIFSTDIDSRDFAMHKPQQVIDSVMSQLNKRGKGIVLLHDFHRNTAQALPGLLRDLKEGGFKIVHLVPKAQLATIAKYDEISNGHKKLSSDNTRSGRDQIR
jgi:peptidoglycan/xylan/chitin deacetylase (PgdA/CDA1 family)